MISTIWQVPQLPEIDSIGVEYGSWLRTMQSW